MRHWSIDEACGRVGVSRLTYIRWEQCQQFPHGSSLRMACEAFGLSAEELGFGDQEIEAKFLKLTSDELLQRYDEEMLRVDALGWVLPHVQISGPVEATHLYVTEPPYSVPAELETRTHDFVAEMKPHFFDSTTIRLDRILHDENGLTLVVRKAHYYDYLATNYVMDMLRDVVHPDRKLEPLETSLLANHIGVSGLVFTSDNYLILPVRSQERVGIWHNLLMPSISGATSFDDDAGSGLASAWIREGRDELRLEKSDFGPITFLGMTRELLRGGKPEAFFTTQLTIPKHMVEQRFYGARDRWENKELQWAADIPALLQEFERMSQPLRVSLALWYKEKHHYGIKH